MSRDVAELLAEAAPDEVGEPDVGEAWRSARRTKVARTLIASTAVLGIFVVVFIAWPHSTGGRRSISIPPAQVQRDDPPTTLDMAGCTPVLAHDGTGHSPGCILSSDLHPVPPMSDAQRLDGVPVYADATGTTQVGAMVDVLGFVPNVSLPKVEELKRCLPNLNAKLADPDGLTLDPTCRALFIEAGWAPSYVDGHGYAP